jgi:hypothetical protein
VLTQTGFIDLGGLSTFVASSYSTQRLISNTMDEALIEFGEMEQQRLCKTMRRKKITLAEDETFHPETCLVSIEPTFVKKEATLLLQRNT